MVVCPIVLHWGGRMSYSPALGGGGMSHSPALGGGGMSYNPASGGGGVSYSPASGGGGRQKRKASHPQLLREFEASLDYMNQPPCLKTGMENEFKNHLCYG